MTHTSSLIDEEWRRIAGTQYDVSSHGRVRNATWRILKASTLGRRHQYLRVNLCSNGLSRYHSVHSLVASAFIGPRPPGFTVDHIDGNKHNNTPSNLEYVTHAENIRRASAAFKRGTQRRDSVLTDEAVREIRRLAISNMKCTAIGRALGFKRTTVWMALHGRSWRHVA